ncbi:MAG: endonuclease [Pedobacter sp.]|nr:MAG: endonuclease [Pedobacter sp.]
MKKRKITNFDKLIFLITFFLVLGMILGIKAGTSDPREHTLTALFGLAYPFFLLANLILLGYWLIRKKWIIAVSISVIICFGWSSLIATFGMFGTTGDLKKEDDSLLRVMTYNVHNFRPYGEKINPFVAEKMLNVVSRQSPDVVCFQEFYETKTGPYDMIDTIKKVLDMPYYHHVPSKKFSKETMGMAIFSKYPIKDTGRIRFEGVVGNESIFADLQLKTDVVRVYNVHFQSISFEPEDYTYLEKVKKDMDPEMASSKRIVRMLMNAFKKRAEQIQVIKDHMGECKTPYIIAGDFNDTPASYAVTNMMDSLNNAFVKKGQGFGKTYNGKFPNFQIDYIAATKDFEVVNYKIIEAKLSDHFPVRSDLRLLKK